MDSKATIKQALIEDLQPNGDITSFFSIEADQEAKAKIIAKEDGIFACGEIIEQVLEEAKNILAQYHSCEFSKSKVKLNFKNGESFKKGDELLSIEAPSLLLLSTERTILNFLQRLCGVASLTKEFTQKISNYKTQLLDTRKTTPGFRMLEKQAVKDGGGTNHRLNLSDMVLIKENHLAFAGKDKFNTKELYEFITGLKNSLQKSNINDNNEIKIECEIENIKQLEAVIKAEVDIIMLDNFSPQEIIDALEEINKLKIQLAITKDFQTEASGGINQETIESYAQTGVDYISTGSITTQARNLDLSMLIESL